MATRPTEFIEKGVRRVPIHDVDLLCTGLDRADHSVQLWNHPIRNASGSKERLDIVDSDFRDPRAAILNVA